MLVECNLFLLRTELISKRLPVHNQYFLSCREEKKKAGGGESVIFLWSSFLLACFSTACTFLIETEALPSKLFYFYFYLILLKKDLSVKDLLRVWSCCKGSCPQYLPSTGASVLIFLWSPTAFFLCSTVFWKSWFRLGKSQCEYSWLSPFCLLVFQTLIIVLPFALFTVAVIIVFFPCREKYLIITTINCHRNYWYSSCDLIWGRRISVIQSQRGFYLLIFKASETRESPQACGELGLNQTKMDTHFSLQKDLRIPVSSL